VARHLRLGELLVGVAGLGLMRHAFTGDDAAAAARMEEIRGIVDSDDEVYDLGVDVPVLDARSGYARWAETYDRPGNPLISAEQSLIWAMFDVAACALALEHVADLDVAVSELARVVRPGGRIVLSDLHPAVAAVGGCAYFRDAAGGAAVVRGYRHLHGDYLRAFRQAGLVVEQSLEPLIGHEEVQMQGSAAFIPAAAEAAYLGLPMALIWDLRRP